MFLADDVWFKMDKSFNNPSIVMLVQLESNLPTLSVHNSAMTHILKEILVDCLSRDTTNAVDAGYDL